MKKIVGLGLVLVVGLMLIGCQPLNSNDRTSTKETVSYLDKGLGAAKAGNYSAAKKYFERSHDEKSLKYLKQLKYLETAQDAYSDKDYQLASDNAKAGMKVENSSEIFKDRLQSLNNKVINQLEKLDESNSKRQTSSKVAVSQSSSSKSESGNSTDGESSGISADQIRKILLNNFGCNESEVTSIPDKALVKIYNDCSSDSPVAPDISRIYQQVKLQYPAIGGNISNTTSEENDTAPANSITIDEALSLINNSQIAGDDYIGTHSPEETTINSDGSVTLMFYSGAQGKDIWTVKPSVNGTATVAMQYGSVKDSTLSEPQSMTIPR